MNYSDLTNKTADAQIARWKAEYADLIKPRAVVEDMIEDAIHVDRQKLQIWKQLHAPESIPKETEEERLERYGREMLRPPVVLLQ